MAATVEELLSTPDVRLDTHVPCQPDEQKPCPDGAEAVYLVTINHEADEAGVHRACRTYPMCRPCTVRELSGFLAMVALGNVPYCRAHLDQLCPKAVVRELG